MGSPEDEPGREDDETQHNVRLSAGLWVLATEVTNRQWEAVMKDVGDAVTPTPGVTPGPGETPTPAETPWRMGTPTPGPTPEPSGWEDLPKVFVSWIEAVEFCNRLSDLSGLSPAYSDRDGDGGLDTWDRESEGFRLPTEAEWEYLARAGTRTAFYNGEIQSDTIESCDSEDGVLTVIGWYCANSGGTLHAVGQKAPNDWGLYDMSGNAAEWVWDAYERFTADEVADPVGPRETFPTESERRCFRGGNYETPSKYCRSASRNGKAQSKQGAIWNEGFENIGFRVVRTVVSGNGS